MAGVKRFEDLVCWQLATELEDLVPALVANPKAAAEREFCDQLLRATAKVAPQIAEGFARFKPGETAYYLRIAKGSLAEVQTQLDKARRRGYLPDEQQSHAEELARRPSVRPQHSSRTASKLLGSNRNQRISGSGTRSKHRIHVPPNHRKVRHSAWWQRAIGLTRRKAPSTEHLTARGTRHLAPCTEHLTARGTRHLAPCTQHP